MMAGYEGMAPAADKWLHADGSVTTLAGEEILPADQNRAEDFASRAASADKWLHEDGSVTDRNGNVLLEANEQRAQDFESRLPEAVKGLIPGSGEAVRAGFPVTEDWRVLLQPFIKTGETLSSIPVVISDGGGFCFIPFADCSEMVEDNFTITDTASAVLS
jgi:hypothetical protein